MERAEASRSIIELEAPDLQVGIEELPDKDWVAESLKGLPAVKAGPYVVAGAHELAKVNGGVIPIWIEAGPAFGTGHHGTTMGCLEALARLARRKSLGRVLDLGTGSGVPGHCRRQIRRRSGDRHGYRRTIGSHRPRECAQ